MRRRIRYALIKFLRLKGAPRKVALGFAIGACVNFYPTFGVGVPLAGLLAAMAMSSIPAGLLGDVAFKPLFPVFFYLNLVTGYIFWPQSTVHGMWRELHRLQEPHGARLISFLKIGKVFFAGALLNSLLLGTIVYSIVYFIMRKYRHRLLKLLIRRG